MEYKVCKQYSTCISCLLCVILFIQSSAFEDGDIRLMYNEREHESKGRLEVYYRGEWGTVCNSGWSNQDARAACRQLHYRYGLAVWSGVYGDGSGPIWLHNVGCYSSRVLLRDCNHSPLGEHTCTHAQDVGVQCWNETSLLPIRLIDGDQLATSSGRVEVLFNEEWGSICVNWYWDHEEARTVCRQLGFTHGTAIAGTIHGSTGGRTWIGDLNCGADAAALLQCSFSPMNRHSCDHDAAVTCQNGTDIPIRLRDGSEVARSEGRVEIQYHGVWWSICADRFWSAYDATVICRELGYQSGYPVRGGMYGAAEERALMSELKCGRDISKLLECGFEVLGSDLCLNDRNAGVICVNDILSQFPVRIIGGSDGSDAYGRLELFKDNVWHSVCAATNNYNNNARVACRQLGYTRGHAIARGVLENKPERLWLPEFACTGTENSILECDFTLEGRRLNDCDYDAAIACWNDTIRPVRLISNGDVVESSGIVELWYAGQWNTICGDSTWGQYEALLICRMLGYENGLTVASDNFGISASPVLLKAMYCNRRDTDIMLCSRYNTIWPECSSSDAAVSCYNESTSTPAPSSDTVSVESINPSQGPVAGGTIVTITGNNLLTLHDDVTVSLLHLGVPLCTDVAVVSRTRLVCITVALPQQFYDGIAFPLAVALVSAGQVVTGKGVAFAFKRNPLITSIYPLETIISGGVPLTIEGDNLDVAEDTQLLTEVVKNETSLASFETNCTKIADNKLTCPTPTLNVTYNNQQLSTEEGCDPQVEFCSSEIDVYIGLTFDGYNAYEDLRNHTYLSGYSELSLVMEPVVDESGGDLITYKTWWPHTAGKLTVQGERLRDKNSSYRITVGDADCTDVLILDNAIQFLPPDEQHVSTENGTDLPVLVLFGNLRFHAYSLRYESTIWQCYTCRIGLIMGTVGVVLIVALVVAVCVFYKMRSKDGKKRDRE